jgi:hypothetical protein
MPISGVEMLTAFDIAYRIRRRRSLPRGPGRIGGVRLGRQAIGCLRTGWVSTSPPMLSGTVLGWDSTGSEHYLLPGSVPAAATAANRSRSVSAA